MSVKRILVRAEAEADIKDAYDWYEAQRKGLGESFFFVLKRLYLELLVTLKYIQQTPCSVHIIADY